MLPGTNPLVSGLLVLLSLFGLYYWWKHRNDNSGGGYATQTAMKKLLHRVPPPGTLIMGWDTSTKKFICTSRETWIATIAGQRSGKTSTVVIPNLEYWVGPKIIASVKPDLMFETAINDGKTFMFAPGLDPDVLRHSPIPSIGYSVLDQIIELIRANRPADAYTAALQRAQALCSSVDMSSTKNGSFWEGAAEGLLASCFLAVAYEPDQYTMTDLCNAPGEPMRLKEFADVLLTHDADELAIAILSDLVDKPPNDPATSSVRSTATVALKPYRFPDVRATAERPDRFRPAQLFEPGKQQTLYLLGSAINQDNFAPVLTALLDEVIQYQYARAAQILMKQSVKNAPAFTPEQTLLLALDEAANIFPYKQMATLASTGAGSGISGIVAYQDLSQARKRLGEEDVQTLLNNMHGLCILHGTKDEKTLSTVSSLVGEREKTTLGGSSTKGQHTASWQQTQETLLTPAKIRTIKRGTVVIIYGSEKPIMATAAHRNVTGPVRPRTPEDGGTNHAAPTAETPPASRPAQPLHDGGRFVKITPVQPGDTTEQHPDTN